MGDVAASLCRGVGRIATGTATSASDGRGYNA